LSDNYFFLKNMEKASPVAHSPHSNAGSPGDGGVGSSGGRKKPQLHHRQSNLAAPKDVNVGDSVLNDGSIGRGNTAESTEDGSVPSIPTASGKPAPIIATNTAAVTNITAPMTPAANRRNSLRSVGMLPVSTYDDASCSPDGSSIGVNTFAPASPRPSIIQLDLELDQAPTGSAHSYEHTERSGFCRHINSCCDSDPMLAHLLPLNPATDDLFVKNGDGLLLCK
jgi:hypothetical protein